jgi:hypothetical protein
LAGAAVRGVVGSFAVTAGSGPTRTAVRHIAAGLDEDLLVALLDEVIYRLDADGEACHGTHSAPPLPLFGRVARVNLGVARRLLRH